MPIYASASSSDTPCIPSVFNTLARRVHIIGNREYSYGFYALTASLWRETERSVESLRASLLTVIRGYHGLTTYAVVYQYCCRWKTNSISLFPQLIANPSIYCIFSLLSAEINIIRGTVLYKKENRSTGFRYFNPLFHKN